MCARVRVCACVLGDLLLPQQWILLKPEPQPVDVGLAARAPPQAKCLLTPEDTVGLAASGKLQRPA